MEIKKILIDINREHKLSKYPIVKLLAAILFCISSSFVHAEDTWSGWCQHSGTREISSSALGAAQQCMDACTAGVYDSCNITGMDLSGLAVPISYPNRRTIVYEYDLYYGGFLNNSLTFSSTATGGVICPPHYQVSDTGECNAYCPIGAQWDITTSSCIRQPAAKNACTTTNNPIDLIDGEKYRQESVIAVGTVFPIEINYSYNSRSGLEYSDSTYGAPAAVSPSAGFYLADSRAPLTVEELNALVLTTLSLTVGDLLFDDRYYSTPYWRHNYEQWLTINDDLITWNMPKAREINFDIAGGYSYDGFYHLKKVSEQWEISDSRSGLYYFFDDEGKLVKLGKVGTSVVHNVIYENSFKKPSRIVSSDGAYVDIEYIETPTNISFIPSVFGAVSAYLPAVFTNSAGEKTTITWTSSGDDGVEKYSMISRISKQYPNLSAERHYYYESDHFLYGLTKITDSTNNSDELLYATFAYDEAGRATMSTLANGVDAKFVEYTSNYKRKVMNALGLASNYTFVEHDGVARLSSIVGEATASCGETNVSYEYNDKGLVSHKSKNGLVTTYNYNNANRESSRTEAVGTPEERTFLTEWHPSHYLKTKITETDQIVEYTYDAEGRLLTQTRSSNDLIENE